MDVPIRDWTLTHWCTRPFFNRWFKTYHKNITYSGFENVDWEKPLIFAVSHQNAFSDALCIISPTSYKDKHFIYPLTRADAFGHNFLLDWVLTVFHMFPVYRPRDKVDLKRQNKMVFEQCSQILKKKRNLLIHPEGICIPKRRVGPFKKGLARIAFAAERQNEFKLGVDIIPVGVNYRNITEARAGIHVQYGLPVAVKDFEKNYHQHEAQAIVALTEAVRDAVKNVTVDVKSDDYYTISENLFVMNKNRFSEGGQANIYRKQELLSNKTIAHSLDEINRNNPAQMKKMSKHVSGLKKLLREQKLLFSLAPFEEKTLTALILQGVLFILLLPLIVYGLINNIIPWAGMHKFTDRVKERQFISSARYTAGAILFTLIYILQTVVVFISTKSWHWSFAYLVTLPWVGILALNEIESFKKWKNEMRYSMLPHHLKNKIRQRIAQIFSEIA